MSDRQAIDVVRQAAAWFEPSPDGFGPLLDTIGDASVVLIGEASHGTTSSTRRAPSSPRR